MESCTYGKEPDGQAGAAGGHKNDHPSFSCEVLFGSQTHLETPSPKGSGKEIKQRKDKEKIGRNIGSKKN